MNSLPSRPSSWVLIVSTCAASWLAMQIVHEAGHVLHAWWSGGTVTHVVLHPLSISRTDVRPNPHPQFVAWGGPLWGSALPLAALGLATWLKLRIAYLFRFFAGFCCVANGAYLGVGVWYPVGDAADLLRAGAAEWQLALFGLLLVPAGLWLWNGLGPQFGWGNTPGPFRTRDAYLMLAFAVGIVVCEVLLLRIVN